MFCLIVFISLCFIWLFLTTVSFLLAPLYFFVFCLIVFDGRIFLAACSRFSSHYFVFQLKSKSNKRCHQWKKSWCSCQIAQFLTTFKKIPYLTNISTFIGAFSGIFDITLGKVWESCRGVRIFEILEGFWEGVRIFKILKRFLEGTEKWEVVVHHQKIPWKSAPPVLRQLLLGRPRKNFKLASR